MENSSTLISDEIENEEELTSEENTQEVEEPAVDETSNEGVENEVEKQPEGKFYTDEEFNRAVNEVADRRVARKMRKFERELDKYKDTENVLKSQLGGENIDEINTNLRNLYENEGVQLPSRYVSEDKGYIEYLATQDSDDVIAEGYDAIKSEANRLATIGYDNLNSKDKIVFTKLCDALDKEEDKRTLKSLNVDTKILEDNDFISYRQQFNRNVPISKIYEMYSGIKETKINTPGDLSNNSVAEKEYFTDEEIANLSMEDLDDPVIWEKVRKSQTRKK